MRVTYDQYLRITADSENRYEYIDGEMYMLASPLYRHQKVVREIYGEFIAWFRGKDCEPLDSPFDITLYRVKRKKTSILLFEPYRKGPHGEFGLGLSIVRRVAENHQATVTADEQDGGVAFRLSIPGSG